MSCIDSAIIRALVEHIGMNPDEIPTTGGTSSGTSIDLGQLGTKIVSTSTFGTVYGAENCMICDYHSSYDARLSVGAVLRLETIAGEIETYICFSNEIEFEFMNIKNTSKTLKFSYANDEGTKIFSRLITSDIYKSFSDSSNTGLFNRAYEDPVITFICNVANKIYSYLSYVNSALTSKCEALEETIAEKHP